MNTIIEIMGLTKNYGKERGVIDLNLSIEKGEVFGFIGPNGAGKSTTIRSLLGLITPTSGTVKLLNQEMNHKNQKKILSEIGYMPSEVMFYNDMKVSDVISFSASMFRKDCTKEAKRLCERLQLDEKKKIEQLSLGNKKKVAIVCALQHNPSLLILDEPTSGLDPLMQREFFSLLQEKNKKGTTIFLSSHILSEIQHNCTSAAIIREGRLVVKDKVTVLASTNTRRVVIRASQTDTEQLFQFLKKQKQDYKNINKLEQSNNHINFLYTGDINQLLQWVSLYSLQDIQIIEPDLEEVFMDYYIEGGVNNGTI